ncbi:MAG: hypothetical protein LBM96_10860 [Methanobrevibacter sp.]|jgi:hypothetical protein|nr:hypothetical protein [Candidatus Methanoflexus mossambicus]
MALIAQNHFQFILEIGAIVFALVFFVLNFLPMTISIITFVALAAMGLFAFFFGLDLLSLFTSSGQSELTHPFGPVVLLFTIVALASLKIMKNSGSNVFGLNRIVWILIGAITLFGALMHRSFLLLWLVGLFIGYFILNESFREKTILSFKRILLFLCGGAILFGLLELVSQVLQMTIFSPLARISRIESNSISSIKMVFENLQLIGHNGNASFWGTDGTAFAEGYIALPASFILFFGLPFPLFFGYLITQKDTVDYMLPGILGYGFDFGFLGFLVLILFVLATIFIGFKILYIYREKRENNNRRYYGREVLLIGSLTAFIAQALIGLFIFNRTINGSALLTFLVIAAMVWAHSISFKRA